MINITVVLASLLLSMLNISISILDGWVPDAADLHAPLRRRGRLRSVSEARRGRPSLCSAAPQEAAAVRSSLKTRRDDGRMELWGVCPPYPLTCEGTPCPILLRFPCVVETARGGFSGGGPVRTRGWPRQRTGEGFGLKRDFGRVEAAVTIRVLVMLLAPVSALVVAVVLVVIVVISCASHPPPCCRAPGSALTDQRHRPVPSLFAPCDARAQSTLHCRACG